MTQAQIISYEEYYPYGSTSYQAGRSAAEVSLKRYRYTGKERDEETGFAYHGARYYASWLGRWVSCDPAGLFDGVNLYRYSRNAPTMLVDVSGMAPEDPEKAARAAAAQRVKTVEKQIGQVEAELSQVKPKIGDVSDRIVAAREHLNKLEALREREGGIRNWLLVRGQERHIKTLDKELKTVIEQGMSLANKIESLRNQAGVDRAFLREPDGDLKRAIKDALKRHVERGSAPLGLMLGLATAAAIGAVLAGSEHARSVATSVAVGGG